MTEPERRSPLDPRRSLSGRIVLTGLALLLAIQAASFWALRDTMSQHGRQTLAAELVFAEGLTRKLIRNQAERVTAEAAVFAEEARFKARLEGERTDIEALLASRAYNRLNAALAAVVDNALAVKAAWKIDDENAREIVGTLAWRAGRREGGANVIQVVDGRPIQIVIAPVTSHGRQTHWLLVGVPLAERLVGTLRDFSPVDLTLVMGGETPGTWRVLASTLAAERQPHDLDRTMATLRAATGIGTPIVIGGDEHLGWLVPLGTGEPVHALLSRSLVEAVAPYRALQFGLAVLTIAGVLLFALGSIVTARHVTTPLRTLVTAARRVGGGDYRTPIGPVRSRDEIGDLAQAFEQMRHDVAFQQDQIARLAYWDRLTDLPNRALFTAALRSRLQHADGTAPLAVVLCDLDRFKHVNDVLGYAVGDMLLVQVATRLRDLFGEKALVARLSSDEFAILLYRAGAPAALAAAQRLEASFARPLVIEDQTIDLAAGIGIACYPDHGSDAETVIAHAEAAMYAAKKSTSGHMLYDPALDAGSVATLSLLSELRQAVAEGELDLFLQPRVSLADGALLGAEALVRWRHPERGFLSPAGFIPFAEQTGFIRTLTHWVAEEACRRSRELQEAGIDIVVSLNLSARDLVDVRIAETLGDLLLRHGTSATRFCLEITESTMMEDPDRALQTLERLHRMGFRLAIDDFGTGYSSLSYLKRLPVDELKIDKSFVSGMEEDPDDEKIVRSTIDLAHNLGLRVVAEGVETDAVVARLRALDCDEAQGYRFARPMMVEDFIEWALRRHGRPVEPPPPGTPDRAAAQTVEDVESGAA